MNLPFDIPKTIYPFEYHFLDLGNSTNIHYVDEGQGPLLLMLHGNPTWSLLYRKMILGLRNNFRCIALDYPGFGLSTAPKGYGFTPREHSEVLEQFVNILKLKDFTLIMQDWGGPIGLGLAGRHPELVKGLIIGNTWAWPLVGNRRFEMFSALMGGPIGHTIAYLFNGVVRFFLKEGLVNKLDPQVYQLYLAPFKNRSNRKQTVIFPRQLIKAADYLSEVEAGLSKLQDLPVLFPWGKKDFAFRDTELERFQKYFPNHKVLPLEASHFWQEDASEELVDAVNKWEAFAG